MHHRSWKAGLAAACALAVMGCGDDELSLTYDIMPVFRVNCAPCHTRVGGLPEAVALEGYLEEPEDIFARTTDSGDFGQQIIPGDSEASFLIQIMRQQVKSREGNVMPKPPNDPVSPASVDVVAQWVDQGAKKN